MINLLLCIVVFIDTSVVKHNAPHGEDMENPAASPEHRLREPGKLDRKFRFLEHIYKTKLKHMQALELAKMLCAEIVKSRTLIDKALLATPIVTAARLGIHELVFEIVKAFPDAIWSWDGNQRYIFHLAVLYRKEKVYNLVYQMSSQKHYVMSYTDKFGNNILHLAGKLEPSNRISGAALQMQRELQWFKVITISNSFLYLLVLAIYSRFLSAEKISSFTLYKTTSLIFIFLVLN